jgi:aspartyl protease family protein
MKLNKIVVTTLLSSTIFTLALLSFAKFTGNSNQAIAQDLEGCFMITSQGKRVNLNSLCSGNSDQSTQPTGSPSTPAQTQTDPNGTIKVRIKRRANGIPIVDVIFNGNRVYEMMLDTGASHTLITQEMARSLNVVPYNYADFTIADGSVIKFPVGEVKSIELGSFKIQVMPVTISSKSDIGLLGNDFYGQFDIKIGKNEIELSPRKLF